VTVRGVRRWMLAGAALAGAFAIGRTSVDRPGVQAPVCRPSAAARAAIDRRTALLFGNSQIHDGDWRFPGVLTVNCARQGMTLHSALSVAGSLPEVAPTVVILGFGAVEALQAADRGAAPDTDAAARDMAALLGDLHARWPGAELIVLGTPPMRPALLSSNRRSAARLGPLNAAIERAAQSAGAKMLDPAAVLPADDGGLSSAMTHDGVHLTEAAYGLVQAQILAASPRLGADEAR
jgi:lysophospholipase L1-like esterase